MCEVLGVPSLFLQWHYTSNLDEDNQKNVIVRGCRNVLLKMGSNAVSWLLRMQWSLINNKVLSLIIELCVVLMLHVIAFMLV